MTIVTGDHRTDLVRRFIDEITDANKLPENEQDVVIDGDNWIGANTSIMKGVKLEEVQSLRPVVTKNVPDNTVVGGIPAKQISTRQL